MTTFGVLDGAKMGAALADQMGPSLQPYALSAGIVKVPLSLTPAAVAANTTVEQSFSLPGALPTDGVDVTPPALTNGVACANARISAANTLQLQFVNSTSGSLTPPAGVHIVNLFR
jgi:hypothetical protein